MDSISYKLNVFEGPLDLLLHLITKHKLDIHDIPIFELVEQYIDAVRQMQQENMEIASEFLEMAARLVYIKSISLLPVHEEVEKLKQELSGELLEYQDCQLMAKKLSEQTDGFEHFTREPQVLEEDPTYSGRHEVTELLRAYFSAVGKGKRFAPPPIDAFKTIVSKKIVSVSSKIIYVLRRLIRGNTVSYQSFFETAQSRSEMVATFLAMLELIKAKRISVDGTGKDCSVKIVREAEKIS